MIIRQDRLNFFAIGVLSVCFLLTELPAYNTVFVVPDTVYCQVGDTFGIDIVVSGDFLDLWGYQYMVTYNTMPLTAIDFVSYDPFTYPWPSEINDPEGYVAVAFSEPMGWQNGPDLYARLTHITFQVDTEGTSILNPDDPEWPDYLVLVDVHAYPIVVDTVLTCYFSTSLEIKEEHVQSIMGREQDYRLYPNPFISFTSIPGHETERFALYDISGRLLGINMGSRLGEGLSAGVYFVRSLDRNSEPVQVVKVR